MNLIPTWSRSLSVISAVLLALAGNASARNPQPSYDRSALLTPQPTSFAQCPQFFARGTPPTVVPAAKRRELCYEAFAVLHDGSTRTPLYVAQR